MESPGERDVYTFNAQAGQVVFFDALSNSSLDWRATDENGRILFDTCFGCGDPGVRTLTRGGIYTITVYDRGAGTGTYQFQVLGVPAPDHFPITVGDLVSPDNPAAGAGNIESPGALDVYTFSGQAAQIVFFDVLATSNPSLDWRVVNEDGRILFDTCLGCGDPGVRTLTRDGMYTIVVYDNGAGTGTYQFELRAAGVTPTPTPNEPPPQSFPISIGDTVLNGMPTLGAGNIESPGARDVYTFTATAGQVAFFDDQGHLGQEPRWTLLDADGQVLYDSYFDDFTATLTRGGTYILHVYESGDGIATYRFKLWNVPLPQSFPVSIGDTVLIGMPTLGAGNIESPGARDVYTFTATAGQVAFFDDQGHLGQEPRWTLLDADGQVLYDSYFDDFTATLTRGGTYILHVYESGDGIATYRFKLWNVPPPQSFPISIGDAVLNGMPTLGAGNIESPGARDVYTFTATAGQVVFFDDQGHLGQELRWRLLDADGEVLYDSYFDDFVATLTRGGTYILHVYESGDGIATYRFKLWNVPPPDRFPISIGDKVLNGSPARGAGNIESPGTRDVYTFTATPGQIVLFDDQGHSTPALHLRLISADGEVLYFGGDPFQDFTRTLRRGGPYTLAVFAAGDAIGTYRFQIRPQ